MAATRVHVVLGAGGVKTLAYVGALEVLQDAGIEFESVSACSAGSLIGALVASGTPIHRIREGLEATDLGRIRSRPTLPGWLRYLAWLRWPFAPYDSAAVVSLMQELLGGRKTFADLPIPFATAGIDLLSQRLLVYSTERHQHMPVADAVRIAVGIPLMFPPHDVGGRVVVDAAIATQCPVWMVGRFDDEYPIVAMKPVDASSTTPPRGLRSFLVRMLSAGVACRDQYLMDEIPRTRVLEMPVTDLAPDDFEEAQRRKAYLFEVGRRVAQQCLQRWGPDLGRGRPAPARPGRRDASGHDENALATASSMMHGFANRLSRMSRNQLFISYCHRDREWLEVLKAPLAPYVELRGIEVWDDTRIQPGEQWRDAITDALASTRVAVLLVSPGFLRSPFIRAEELAYFLGAAERFAVTVHWLALSDLDGEPNPLGARQALLDASTPLDRMPAPDLVRALAEVARRVAKDLEG